MAIDYEKLFLELAAQRQGLTRKREAIDAEIAQLTPLLQGTFDMLAPVQQVRVGKQIKGIEKRPPGLKQGVLMALAANGGKFLTPPEIRDYLESIGFDFGAASDRGLSSVGTTLKRMVDIEVEAKTLESGQMGYRKRVAPPPLAVPMNTDGGSWIKRKK
jgi:hypothetical protein